MKILFLLASMSLLISCGNNEKSSEKEKSGETKNETSGKMDDSKPAGALFNIKAAKIVFNYADGYETGTETLYFDEYGNRAVLVVDKKGKMGNTTQVQICKDKHPPVNNHE